ncbi:hypothetical protein CSOJ01_01372 [Colletotrichum sojae]|uniref:Uncharacterized protein n=1 Tax=Colletotrichum sojae TaxID=2175907 RepID=A0A8H6JV10_9PEZI|nr:hypothetical protein CSOJ01_01372 [Colletotrichum sojae]
MQVAYNERQEPTLHAPSATVPHPGAEPFTGPDSDESVILQSPASPRERCQTTSRRIVDLATTQCSRTPPPSLQPSRDERDPRTPNQKTNLGARSDMRKTPEHLPTAIPLFLFFSSPAKTTSPCSGRLRPPSTAKRRNKSLLSTWASRFYRNSHEITAQWKTQFALTFLGHVRPEFGHSSTQSRASRLGSRRTNQPRSVWLSPSYMDR